MINGAIWAGVQFGSPPSGGGGGGSSGCTWRLANPHDAGLGAGGSVTKELNGIVYALYQRSCAGTSVLYWIPQTTPGQLGQQAANVVVGLLWAPTPRTAPPAARGVVNVGMWVWDAGSWSPRSVTAWVPTPYGVSWATTTATPVGLEYRLGDGSVVTCSGRGSAWQPAFGDDAASSCMATYRHAGRYGAQVGLRWAITFRSSSGVSGSLGSHTTWASLPVDVAEVQALVTS